MAYDRSGKTVSKPTEPANEPMATPNAARVRRGQPLSGQSAASGRSARPAGTARAAARAARLRVLPVVIFLGGVLLTVKVADLWTGVRAARSPVSVAAYAEAESKAGPIQLAQAPAPAQQEASKPAEKPLDPVLFTRSEIELLQDLSKRRKELDAREEAIIQKEGLLTAAEDRIEKKIAEMQKIKTELEALIKKYDAQEEKEIESLVAIYEKMKPQEAARIFDELEMDILLRVFDRMKTAKSALVLANMKPQRAMEITQRIAERQEMPKVQ